MAVFRLWSIEQTAQSKAAVATLFRVVTSIGGNNGWYFADWLWRLRGLVDRLLGGIGLQRGRRHPTEIRQGEVLDFWRVEQCEPNRLLKLRGEMIVWGDAWLEFEMESLGPQHSRLIQRALYNPRGIGGRIYWCSLYPVHCLIFKGLAGTIAKKAEAEEERKANASGATLSEV